MINRTLIFIPHVTSLFCVKWERDVPFYQDRVMHVREWFQFQACSHNDCFQWKLTHRQLHSIQHTVCTVRQHKLLLFRVSPGAGKKVSSGLSLFGLSLCTPHPGVSPSHVPESWVPVPRTFACFWCLWWQSSGKTSRLHLKRINWKQYVKS